jgi:hypothetical protein
VFESDVLYIHVAQSLARRLPVNTWSIVELYPRQSSFQAHYFRKFTVQTTPELVPWGIAESPDGYFASYKLQEETKLDAL